MTALERLRQAAELLPAGAQVTVTREALLEALGGTADVCSPTVTAGGDLTVAEVAVHFRRSPSTIRTWLEGDRFPGAYKLNGRDWRVPLAAIEAFARGQQASAPVAGVDLGAWRQHRARR